MEKTFTVNVPDDLWVDSWTENKTTTYTYNGPETIYVVVQMTDEFPVKEWSVDPITREIDSEKELVVELDADANTDIAYYYYHNADEWTYEYTTITNHDGSTHEEFTNPKLEDIYEVKYEFENGFILSPIIKETQTQAERIAIGRLEYIEKYNNAFDFEDADQSKIDACISDLNTYLDSMSAVYPWRYVTIDTSTVPKIPAALTILFNALPEID